LLQVLLYYTDFPKTLQQTNAPSPRLAYVSTSFPKRPIALKAFSSNSILWLV
jgi:hypothetical protein